MLFLNCTSCDKTMPPKKERFLISFLPNTLKNRSISDKHMEKIMASYQAMCPVGVLISLRKTVSSFKNKK